MIVSSGPQQTRLVYYLDSSVLLNLFLGFSRPNESNAAKRFMDKIARGAADGIVSTWTLMEIRRIGEHAKELDFEIISEGWNVYALSDDSVLRIRPVVFKVLETHQLRLDGTPVRGFAASNVVSVRVPESLKQGSTAQGETTIDQKTPVDFRAVRKVWNEYAVEGGLTLRVKLVVTRIVRSSKFNTFGEPVYLVSSDNVADFHEKI